MDTSNSEREKVKQAIVKSLEEAGVWDETKPEGHKTFQNFWASPAVVLEWIMEGIDSFVNEQSTPPSREDIDALKEGDEVRINPGLRQDDGSKTADEYYIADEMEHQLIESDGYGKVTRNLSVDDVIRVQPKGFKSDWNWHKDDIVEIL